MKKLFNSFILLFLGLNLMNVQSNSLESKAFEAYSSDLCALLFAITFDELYRSEVDVATAYIVAVETYNECLANQE